MDLCQNALYLKYISPAQLQSLNVDEKLCGLHMLSEVFDGRTLEEVVLNRIVRIVAPLLVDPSSTVRNSSAGAIR